ncbi:BEL1-like homeodomain protein 1 [Salvia divinorum]|uniref:BEL1-like homeodomain protein 1 n=1 Tax=Salvia divinorum TaxID=28513 RepID=A0ABD1GJ64_SALDI
MYYQGIEGETLYLMNPNFIDTQPQSNMLFSNPSALLPPHQQEIYSMWGGGNNINPRGLSLSLTGSGDHDFPAAVNNSSNTNMIIGSKYLKAAQELLDEVVSLGFNDKAKPIKDPAVAVNKEAPSANKGGADLTTAQRQEIQIKKAKLHNMLDEVEQRCRQYHQQMQMIVAAFEQATGMGSARSYTQVAMNTILKQFRCLKSTISAQIKALNKSLGEVQGSEVSRLRFVAGMGRNNAWRPQRGLPEKAVSVLRAWLFQHFLHPYPKDSDKQMLAKQTGLTRSQVSNWFINARVRLWKPMVEEMYLHETNNQSSITNMPDEKPRNSLSAGIGEKLFGQGNGFSLSLGLPPSQRSFQFGTEMMDFQNRKPFPPQLLLPPDFVTSTPLD